MAEVPGPGLPHPGAMETSTNARNDPLGVRPDASTTTMAAVKRAVTLPRGTVTFLLTDLQDSTRSWQVDSAAMAMAGAPAHELIDGIVRACNRLGAGDAGGGHRWVAAVARAR